MTSSINNKKFTISLTKAELDAIQKKLIEEYERMLDRVRMINSVPSPSNSEKRYRYDNERDNVIVMLSVINKINNNNNNNKYNNIKKSYRYRNVNMRVIVTLSFLEINLNKDEY